MAKQVFQTTFAGRELIVETGRLLSKQMDLLSYVTVSQLS